MPAVHSNNYSSYTFAAPSSPRYTSSHSTSSAQSASANPDEDWTKISDLAERRRIQNRIAQRNYRKKLKRRLEDLERRAGSSSTSPEPAHAAIVPICQSRPNDEEAARQRRVKTEPSVTSRGRSPVPHPSIDDHGMFARQYTRQLSASPPPAFTYSYSTQEPPPPIHAPYPQHAPFHSIPASYPDYHNPSLYLPPLPATLPHSSGYDALAPESKNPFAEDDVINHFNMSYSSMGGMEVPTTQSYADSNAYTPPLSISHSFDHSRTGSPSDASMMCPDTPHSIPALPHFIMG